MIAGPQGPVVQMLVDARKVLQADGVAMLAKLICIPPDARLTAAAAAVEPFFTANEDAVAAEVEAPVAKPAEQTALRSSCEGLKLKPKARVSCSGKENRSANASCKSVETDSSPAADESARAEELDLEPLRISTPGRASTGACPCCKDARDGVAVTVAPP